ncbi:MAG TPA: hypothetical protein VFG31_07365 [Conexibacter sp.]|nr:hypothetical protein [Conexibacter sp.]
MLTAALACAALAAPVAHAAEPSAQPSVSATLGSALDGLLGTDQQQQLHGLLGQLQSGQAPTGTALAPLQDLLLQLAATPGLPVDAQTLIAQLAGLLGATPDGQPLDPALLMPVATLLRDLAGTSGVPADAAGLLTRLADLLDGSGAAPGLPVDALTLPATLVDRLRDLLDALERGQQPTGTALAPVSDLLDSVAATPQLPDALSNVLGSVADGLRGTNGALDPLVADQARYALDTIASTPGLSPSQRTTIERISTFVSSSGGATSGTARGASKRDRAVIKRIRVNRARTRVAVRVACPRSAPSTCATTVTAKLAGHKAARGKHVRIAAGHSKVVRLRFARAARTASARHGGRLRVQVVTAFGARRFTSAKAVQLKARHQ